jgi:nitrogen-specific signal transduction histidine kinase
VTALEQAPASERLYFSERGLYPFQVEGVVYCYERPDNLAIWDTGIGIPEHQHRDIFREFHQLGNPERDRRKGLGLGLAIVRQIMALHHGNLNIVNLDPAAEYFEYPLTADIRDLIQLDDVMEDDTLHFGPNGGLLFCME